jgi:hypothetical protein
LGKIAVCKDTELKKRLAHKAFAEKAKRKNRTPEVAAQKTFGRKIHPAEVETCCV